MSFLFLILDLISLTSILICFIGFFLADLVRNLVICGLFFVEGRITDWGWTKDLSGLVFLIGREGWDWTRFLSSRVMGILTFYGVLPTSAGGTLWELISIETYRWEMGLLVFPIATECSSWIYIDCVKYALIVIFWILQNFGIIEIYLVHQLDGEPIESITEVGLEILVFFHIRHLLVYGSELLGEFLHNPFISSWSFRLLPQLNRCLTLFGKNNIREPEVAFKVWWERISISIFNIEL